ncbi:MAG: AmmeMemoRadiSam system radical SAM enzyme, partial [Kiritimatiellae bacterium]|nr:AmmeMemoRadiSam system radical SAM enzyme [Kiritimatiellia bacterium]
MKAKAQTRRAFLRTLGVTAAACSTPVSLLGRTPAFPELREAMFYEKLRQNAVRCRLCPWQCVVPDGQRGKCGVRENRLGTYYTLVYGRPVAIHNDPIEKKPFMHVYPGSKALSLATVGCNFDCRFCQNWSISQAAPEDVDPPYKAPDEIAAMAKAAGSRTVAYTYGEPVIFYEYMYDCAQAARALGLGNVLVSNGFIRDEPLQQLLPLLTAVKVDLKSFSPDYYEKVCGGRLEPVLETLRTVVRAGVWLELVVLVVPTLNDSEDEIRRMTAWIRDELGPNVPVNFIRF